MKLSVLSSVLPFVAFASATVHTQEVEVAVVCTDPAPSTVTQTVTVTAYGGSSNQYSSAPGSGHSTTTASVPPPITYTTSSVYSTHTPTIHNVVVGVNGELKYGANQIDAAIGDIIRFDFNSTNHTVTQSDFATPCTPKAGGFNTGFTHFNPSNHTGFLPPVDFEVKVSTPLWFYCAQTVKVSHCHAGMVLGVNPAGKFPAFLSMATATTTATSIPLSTGATTWATTTSKYSSAGSGAQWTASTSTKIPLSTGVSPKPSTGGAYKFKGRRAASEWYA